LAVIACSYLALLLDRYFDFPYMVDDSFLESLADETEESVQLLRENFRSLINMSWNGIQLVHFFSGLMMIGFSGFISMGFFVAPLFDGPRGHRGAEGPIIILVVGTIRVMYGIYGMMRSVSGKLLASAEGMILDVGTGAAEEFSAAQEKAGETPLESTSATEAEQKVFHDCDTATGSGSAAEHVPVDC